MKLLLYCTKAKPYLIRFGNEYGYNQFDTSYCKDEHISPYEYGSEILNGKIVAECDFEVEKIIPIDICEDDYNYGLSSGKNLLRDSCLDNEDICEYLKDYDGETIFKSGYAIHIKNLHIFDEPKELSEYFTVAKKMNTLDGYSWVSESIDRAPQNMMYAYDVYKNHYIVISIRPEWLCKILNGEKTIECRKRILKEMVSK